MAFSNVTNRRIPAWEAITGALENYAGWQLIENKKTKKVFARRNERLIIFKTVENLWKADYHVGRRLSDTSGAFKDEKFVRLMALEMGFLK